MKTEPAAGRLIVATPTLLDPNFDHTVVLLLEYSEEGSLGVVVNRPSDVSVGAVLDPWVTLTADPARVFVGGPVQTNSLLAIGRLVDDSSSAVQPIAPGLGVIDLHREAVDVAGAVTAVRVFAGHAGWGPGQLEEEIATGSWFVLDAQIDDTFASDPEDLWRDVLVRQGGFFVTVPDDPTMN